MNTQDNEAFLSWLDDSAKGSTYVLSARDAWRAACEYKDNQLAARDAVIAKLREALSLAHAEYLEWHSDGETDCITPYDAALMTHNDDSALRDMLAAKDAVIAKLREAYRNLPLRIAKFCFGSMEQAGSVSLSSAYIATAQCLTAKDGLESEYVPNDDSALQVALKQARKDALLKAAKRIDNDVTFFGTAVATWLRRVASEGEQE